MSTIDDIRAAMAQADGPVKPADIAESLDLEPKAVRNALYQAWTQGAGVEKYEDGTYGLIPGWKPRFGTADEAGDVDGGQKAEAVDPVPERKARSQDKAPRTKRATSTAPARGKPGRKPKVQPAAADPAPTSPAPRASNGARAMVTLPLDSVRQLMRHALGSDEPLAPSLRDAVLDAARHCL